MRMRRNVSEPGACGIWKLRSPGLLWGPEERVERTHPPPSTYIAIAVLACPTDKEGGKGGTAREKTWPAAYVQLIPMSEDSGLRIGSYGDEAIGVLWRRRGVLRDHGADVV